MESDFQKLSLSLLLTNNIILYTFQCINKTFNLTLKQTQARKVCIKKFKNIPFFKESIDLLFASVYHEVSQFIVKTCNFQFKTIKRHNFL
jgi:hypothetical protein